MRLAFQGSTTNQENPMSPQLARWMSIALGAWLFVSAFAWTHTTAQFHNAWVTGLVIVGVSSAALMIPRVRYVNTAIAIWLFVSPFALPTASSATMWNHLLVAVATFVLGLLYSHSTHRDLERVQRRHA
jgi:hypothetical protein